MASNHTSNYSLCQWAASDKVLRTDFNADNAKIDAALKALNSGKASTATVSSLKTTVDAKASQAALDSLAATVTAQGNSLKLRNCRFVTGSYQGTGAGTPVTLTFPYKPVLVFVCSTLYANYFLAARGQSVTFRVNTTDTLRNYLVWGAKTLKWSPLADFTSASPRAQMNESGDTYYYFALLEVE